MKKTSKNTHIPFFSICIPTRNRKEILKETLESIFAQTYQSFEIVVSDDDSTDSTRKYCETLVKQKKIRYYHNKKAAGMGMNTHIVGTLGKGKYIFFLADDDLLLPNCLETYHKILINKKLNVGLCRAASYGFLSNKNHIFNVYTAGGKDVMLKVKEYGKLLRYNSTFISGWAVKNDPKLVIGKGYQDVFIEAAYSLFDKYNFYFISEPLIGARVHTNLGYTFYRIVSPWFELEALVKRYAKGKKQKDALRVVKDMMVTDCHNIKIYSGIKNYARHFRWYFSDPIPEHGKFLFIIKSVILYIAPNFLLINARRLLFHLMLLIKSMQYKVSKIKPAYA